MNREELERLTKPELINLLLGLRRPDKTSRTSSGMHMILHHRVAPGKAMLATQPFEDPLGRMPLLQRCRPVRLQDRIDYRK